MAKYENIRALAKKQLQAVTESSDRWKAFLRTAAIAYNYSFPNQLLIHEQSPTATAVADIAYWNNNAGRCFTSAVTSTVPTSIFPKFSARKPNAPKAKALAKAAGAAAATACKRRAVNCVCPMKSAVCVTMSACC